MKALFTYLLDKPAVSALIQRAARPSFGQIFARVTLSAALLLLLPHPAVAESDLSPENTSPATELNAWRFRVWLDEKEIGYHNFYLVENGDISQLHSEAEFEYKLLFVKLYDYEHENRETWKGNCLQSIESSTDANGKPYAVSGHARSGEFELAGNKGTAMLPECVMSFAYWNPAFLKQDRLINTQDGEYLDIEVSLPVLEQREVRGEMLSSYRYSLEAGPLKLDLWYSTDDEWLALESEAQGGRRLRYELL
jgi:hypothetical protein